MKNLTRQHRIVSAIIGAVLFSLIILMYVPLQLIGEPSGIAALCFLGIVILYTPVSLLFTLLIASVIINHKQNNFADYLVVVFSIVGLIVSTILFFASFFIMDSMSSLS